MTHAHIHIYAGPFIVKKKNKSKGAEGTYISGHVSYKDKRVEKKKPPNCQSVWRYPARAIPYVRLSFSSLYIS